MLMKNLFFSIETSQIWPKFFHTLLIKFSCFHNIPTSPTPSFLLPTPIPIPIPIPSTMFQQAIRRSVVPKLTKALTPRKTAAMITAPLATYAGYKAVKSTNGSAFAATQTDQHGGMSSNEFLPFSLTDVQVLSSDTAIYYFGLSSPSAKLNMPMTSYILAKADVDGEQVIRPYTPLADLEGEMALVVKTYPNGKMGNAFASLSPGDTMLFKGPMKKYEYTPNQFDRVTLIAGGTGITPVFQLMDAIISNPDDKTTVHVLYGSRSSEDILLKPLLDSMAYSYPEKVKVTYVIDRPEQGWTGLTGYITPEAITAIHGAPGNPRSKVFVCGPPPMMEAVCGPKGANYTQGVLGNSLLGQLGFNEAEVFKF
jgi:cytochrome-b5 reductase